MFLHITPVFFLPYLMFNDLRKFLVLGCFFDSVHDLKNCRANRDIKGSIDTACHGNLSYVNGYALIFEKKIMAL